MSEIGTFSILTIFLILGDLEAFTVMNYHPEDEYVLEHEVLRKDALAEAKKLEIHSGPIPGCKSCTNSEMTYCKDGSVIKDHCLCDVGSDSRYSKVFFFVEHTCRMGPEEHSVLAGNCAEYTRLRECCCHPYLASVWKRQATGTGSHISINLTKFLNLLMVFVIHLLLT